MGRKRIKNLGKVKKKRRNLKKRKYTKTEIKRSFICVCIFCFIIASYNITKQLSDLYGEKDIENSKIDYYIDIADEASNYNTQINWKDIMAIELVIYEGDLTSVKKKDSLDIAKRFLQKIKSEDGQYIYKIKDIEVVLNELKFDRKNKKDIQSYKEELEYIYPTNKNLNSTSKEIVFIEKIKKSAIENYHFYKILPSITIAQCILESGWGESQLSKSSNNLFGIKADKHWDGESIEVSTTENYDDKIVAPFRVYSNVGDSIKDHGEFLVDNKRYTEHGLFEAKHYTTQAQALEDAGYSTKKDDKGEPIYAEMLINLIKSYNLQVIDSEVQIMK